MSDADTAQVLPVLGAFEAAWAARDAGRLAMLFTENADYIDFAGDHLRGRAAINDAHARVLSGPLARSTFTFVGCDAAAVSDTVTLAHARWDLDGQLRADGSTIITRRGIITFVFCADADERGQRRLAIRAGQNTELRAKPFD